MSAAAAADVVPAASSCWCEPALRRSRSSLPLSSGHNANAEKIATNDAACQAGWLAPVRTVSAGCDNNRAAASESAERIVCAEVALSWTAKSVAIRCCKHAHVCRKNSLVLPAQPWCCNIKWPRQCSATGMANKHAPRPSQHPNS